MRGKQNYSSRRGVATPHGTKHGCGQDKNDTDIDDDEEDWCCFMAAGGGEGGREGGREGEEGWKYQW